MADREAVLSCSGEHGKVMLCWFCGCIGLKGLCARRTERRCCTVLGIAVLLKLLCMQAAHAAFTTAVWVKRRIGRQCGDGLLRMNTCADSRPGDGSNARLHLQGLYGRAYGRQCSSVLSDCTLAQ